MKLLLSSLLVLFICALSQASQECLSVRGHVRCGNQQRQLSRGDDDFGSSGRRGSSSGHGGSSGGRGSSSGGSSWGQQQQSSQGSSNQNPIFIKLVDEDTGGPDDWMDETYASNSGAFQLRGCASDGVFGGHIEPMLRIYHKCKGTPKMFTVEIPVDFIGKEYNLTTVFNLQGPLQNEKDERYPVPECGKRKNFYLFK